MIASTPRPSRPLLALRLGVTGARSLRNDQVTRLREQLRAVLAQAREEMERLAGEHAVSAAYAPAALAEGQPPVPALRFLSPLARGADRLAAEEALAQGYELYVPMPFPQAEYEKDFKGAEKAEEPPLTKIEDLARPLRAGAGNHVGRGSQLSLGRQVGDNKSQITLNLRSRGHNDAQPRLSVKIPRRGR